MSSFAYEALEDAGKKHVGVIEAPDRDAAFAFIAGSGLHVLHLKEQASGPRTPTGLEKRVRRVDIALFTRRLADLASAGLPLDRALGLAGEQSESAELERVTQKAIQDVRAGLSVSDSLAKYPRLFPPVYTMTLRAGEASGQFGEVAGRLAELQQSDVRRRGQVVAALIYPAVLIVTAFFIVAFLTFYVVPRFTDVFKDLGTDLPASTKLLLAIAGFVSKRGLAILAGALAITAVGHAWWTSDRGVLQRDRIILRAAIFGGVAKKAVVSRYARVLGTLVYGGVPILDALRIAGSACGNRAFEEGSTQVRTSVKDGRRISDAMREAGIFPNSLVQMVSVGEETGDLPRMLGRICESLDFEVDNGMQKLISLLEPAIVIGMGALVGFVVISIILPIYSAQDVNALQSHQMVRFK